MPAQRLAGLAFTAQEARVAADCSLSRGGEKQKQRRANKISLPASEEFWRFLLLSCWDSIRVTLKYVLESFSPQTSHQLTLICCLGLRPTVGACTPIGTWEASRGFVSTLRPVLRALVQLEGKQKSAGKVHWPFDVLVVTIWFLAPCHAGLLMRQLRQRFSHRRDVRDG